MMTSNFVDDKPSPLDASNLKDLPEVATGPPTVESEAIVTYLARIALFDVDHDRSSDESKDEDD